jgi:hypothetical protein
MSNELFVELNDEQQEVVSGGAIFQGPFLTTSTSVNNALLFAGGSAANAGGAASGVNTAAVNINNSTLTALGPVAIIP